MLSRLSFTTVLICAASLLFPAKALAVRSECLREERKTNRIFGEGSSAASGVQPQYAIVFPANYKGTRRVIGEAAIDRARSERMKSFINEANALGQKGYKFISAVRGMPVAIFRLDEGKYEYDWFETTSSVHFSKSELNEKLSRAIERRFRVVDHLVISRSCEPADNQNPDYGETVLTRIFF